MAIKGDSDFCDRCGRFDDSQTVGGDAMSEVFYGWHDDPESPSGERVEDLCEHCMVEQNLVPCALCDRWTHPDGSGETCCGKECMDSMAEEDKEYDLDEDFVIDEYE